MSANLDSGRGCATADYFGPLSLDSGVHEAHGRSFGRALAMYQPSISFRGQGSTCQQYFRCVKQIVIIQVSPAPTTPF